MLLKLITLWFLVFVGLMTIGAHARLLGMDWLLKACVGTLDFITLTWLLLLCLQRLRRSRID